MRDPKDPKHDPGTAPADSPGASAFQVKIPATQVMQVMTDTHWPQMGLGGAVLPATIVRPALGAAPAAVEDSPRPAPASKAPVSVGAAFGAVGVVGVGAAYLASQSGSSSGSSAAEPVQVATQVNTPTAPTLGAVRPEGVATTAVDAARNAVAPAASASMKAIVKPPVSNEPHHAHGHGHHGHQPSVKDKFEAGHHGHHSSHHGHHSSHHGHHSSHHGHHDMHAPHPAPIGPGHEYDAWREHGQLPTGQPAYLAPAVLHPVEVHHEDAHHMAFDSGHHEPHTHDYAHASAEVHHDTHHVDDFHASAHIGVHTDIIE